MLVINNGLFGVGGDGHTHGYSNLIGITYFFAQSHRHTLNLILVQTMSYSLIHIVNIIFIKKRWLSLKKPVYPSPTTIGYIFEKKIELHQSSFLIKQNRHVWAIFQKIVSFWNTHTATLYVGVTACKANLIHNIYINMFENNIRSGVKSFWAYVNSHKTVN